MAVRIKISNDLTDEELLNKFKETSELEYWGFLYNRYIPLVYGLCLKYLQQEEKAQDAVMQLFENLTNKLCNYSIDNFKTWMYSVAKNYCLQEIRSEKKNITIHLDTDFVESDQILHLLDEQHSKEDKFSILEKCLKELPEPQRISIELFFFKEKSYVEITDCTTYHLKSVKSYIQNGRRNLKICMEKNRE